MKRRWQVSLPSSGTVRVTRFASTQAGSMRKKAGFAGVECSGELAERLLQHDGRVHSVGHAHVRTVAGALDSDRLRSRGPVDAPAARRRRGSDARRGTPRGIGRRRSRAARRPPGRRAPRSSRSAPQGPRRRSAPIGRRTRACRPPRASAPRRCACRAPPVPARAHRPRRRGPPREGRARSRAGSPRTRRSGSRTAARGRRSHRHLPRGNASASVCRRRRRRSTRAHAPSAPAPGSRAAARRASTPGSTGEARGRRVRARRARRLAWRSGVDGRCFRPCGAILGPGRGRHRPSGGAGQGERDRRNAQRRHNGHEDPPPRRHAGPSAAPSVSSLGCVGAHRREA